MVLQLPGWWHDLASPDFAALDPESTVVVLPVGAIEQHGPHLPVAVDTCLVEAIVRRGLELLDPGTPVLVLPTTAVGKSNEHLAYPGTLTLSAETLARVWYELGASVRRAGLRKLLLFNGHGGQPQVMQIVARELRIDHGMLTVAANWFSWGLPEGLFDAAEIRHGIHARRDRDRHDAGGPPGSGRHGRRRRLRAGHRGRRARLSAAARAGRRRARLADAGPASAQGACGDATKRDGRGRAGRDRPRGARVWTNC